MRGEAGGATREDVVTPVLCKYQQTALRVALPSWTVGTPRDK